MCLDICGVEEQGDLTWSTATTPAFVKLATGSGVRPGWVAEFQTDEAHGWHLMEEEDRSTHQREDITDALHMRTRTFQLLITCMLSKRSELLREALVPQI